MGLNNSHVFQPDPAQARVIQAWLDGNDLASPQNLRGRIDAWALVNLQAKPVPGPVKESLHSSANDASPVPLADK